MSAAKILAELPSLSSAERVQIVEQTLPHLSLEQLKALDRTLRRLTHPEVPEEVWRGYEDYEDGRVVDLEVAMREEPPKQPR